MTIATFSPKLTSDSVWNSFDFFKGSQMGTMTDVSPSYPSEAIELPDFLTLFDVEGNEDILESASIASVTGSFASLSQLVSSPTATISLDFEMMHLLHSVQIRDEEIFTNIADQMDWAIRSPDDLWLGIRFALKVGAHVKARELAQFGKEQYPDHTDLQKAGHILAPPKTLVPDGLSAKKASQSAVANMKWLKENREIYRGQWVALRDGTLLASAETSKDLFAQLENPKDKSVLVTMVY